ncbi:hypothetical protein ACWEJ6_48840 [Nonomuraea sp. NPDC004702]
MRSSFAAMLLPMCVVVGHYDATSASARRRVAASLKRSGCDGSLTPALTRPQS